MVFSYAESVCPPLILSVKPTLNQENVNSVTQMRSQGCRPSERSEPGCLLNCLQKLEESYAWRVFHMPINLLLTKSSGFKLALITIPSCSQSDGVIKIKVNRMRGGGLVGRKLYAFISHGS